MIVSVAMALAATAPSFDCARASTKVEQIICTDELLRQSDRAVDLAYRKAKSRNVKAVVAAQKQWLMDRDACSNLACVADRYDGRLFELLTVSGLGRDYGAGGGSLTVLPLGNGWFAFSAFRTYSRPSFGFPSQMVMTDASASGVFRLIGGKGERMPQAEYDTGWRLTKIRGGWRVECLPDLTACGGINATIDGEYR